MLKLINKSYYKTLGESLWLVLSSNGDLTNKELVINSNSRNTQNIFLDCIEKIVIYNETAVFYGKNGITDFLNLNNVLSISIVGEIL